MPNIVIKLKRWSVEEINLLTGQNSNKAIHETSKKTEKAKILRKDEVNDANGYNDEAKNGGECSKSEKNMKKVTKSQSKMRINNKLTGNQRDECDLNCTLMNSTTVEHRMTRSRTKNLCEKSDSLSYISPPVSMNSDENKSSELFKRRSEIPGSDDTSQQSHKKEKLENGRSIEIKPTNIQSSKKNIHQSNFMQQNHTCEPKAKPKSQSKMRINNKSTDNQSDNCDSNCTLMNSTTVEQRMTRSRSKIQCEKSDSLSIISPPVSTNSDENKSSKSFKRRSEIPEGDDAPQQAHKKRKLEKGRSIAIKPTKTQSSKKNIHQSNSIQQNDTCEPKAELTNNEIAIMDFKIGEVVWAKIRGFPYWPAKIENITGAKKQMFRIYWFNDYRISKVFKSQIFKFHKHFEEHAKMFDTHIGVETAAREALTYLGSQEKK